MQSGYRAIKNDRVMHGVKGKGQWTEPREARAPAKTSRDDKGYHDQNKSQLRDEPIEGTAADESKRSEQDCRRPQDFHRRLVLPDPKKKHPEPVGKGDPYEARSECIGRGAKAQPARNAP